MTELLLVPDSLLQFATLNFDLASFRERIEQDYIFSLVSDTGSEEIENLTITRNTVGKQAPGKEIFLSLESLIAKLFENRWIPLPWLSQIGDNKFQNGPSNWVRGRLKRNPETKAFFMEIAFDTAVERNPGRDSTTGELVYNGPKPDDIDNGTTFTLPHLPVINKDWLAASSWVRDIISNAQEESVKAHLPAYDDDTLPPPQPGDLNHKLTGFAAYLALLHGLTAAEGLPTVKFTDNAAKPIDVDLVLDLGNSRSSGVLIEQITDKALSKNGRFGNCRVLGLRDLRNPQIVRAELFSSRSEFSNVEFGDARLSQRSMRNNAFLWPSAVRVGGEAEEMMAAREGSEGFSGLASPKRYLWDRAPTSQGWYFNDALTSSEATPPRPAQNPRVKAPFRSDLYHILTRKNDRGVAEFNTDLREEEIFSEQQAGPDVISSKYIGICQLSKSQISILMLNELILQAISFMNSPQERESREQSRTPRRLRSLILTFPSGMPLAERRILTKRAKAAITLAWESSNQKDTWARFGEAYTLPPELECNIDEATATQLVWLENEINNKLGGGVQEMFDLYGRNTGPDNKGRLRIASLDIGGGTTDLMICDYLRNPNEEMLHPNQLFRESLRIAGDDLLEDVISGLIVPSLIKYFETCNIPKPQAFFNKLFKLGAADSTIQEATQRQLFISTILEPIALRIIDAYENTETFFSGEIISGKLHEFYNSSEKSTERALNYFRSALEKHFAGRDMPSHPAALDSFLNTEGPPQNQDNEEPDFNPLDAELKVSTEEMEGIIRGKLDNVLRPLCNIIQAYGCDVLLLSGRPSKLPQVRNQILSALPVAPQRVIPMHSYVISGDYPFANSKSQIGDPKSTVVMGAVIWKKACRAEIGNFKLASNIKYEKSTAHFVGNIQENDGKMIGLFNIKKEDGSPIAYDLSDNKPDEKLNIKIYPFEGSMIIGAQQLPNKDFPCSPFYSLKLTDAGRDFLQNRGVSLNKPLSLTFSRTMTRCTTDEERRELCENFVVSEIEGQSNTPDTPPISLPARNFISTTLQTTLTPQGHWRDTGGISLTNIKEH